MRQERIMPVLQRDQAIKAGRLGLAGNCGSITQIVLRHGRHDTHPEPLCARCIFIGYALCAPSLRLVRGLMG
jgi:hypothetical protein